MRTGLAALPFGVAFGVLLAWGHLTDPDVIRDMLLLREWDVFLLMGSAMLVGGIGLHLLRATGTTSLLGAEPITWSRVRPGRDHVLGSVLFGLGWSLADTCPGPVAAQLGSGRLTALATVMGIFAGVALRAWTRRA